MKYIKPYSDFSINEAVGLADATLIYSSFILNKTKFYFDKFLKSGDNKMEQNKSYDLSKREEIISSNLWSKYPVLRMNITFNFEKQSDVDFNERFPITSKSKGFTSTGACYNITDSRKRDMSYLLPSIDKRTEHTIFLKMEIGGIIRDDFNEEEDFLLEIESAIIHELNHAYEGYMRLIKGRGQVSIDLTLSTDINRSKVKNEIWKVWKDKIGYYLYTSERHELNAMVQEAFPYVKKYDPSEMRKKCPSWRTAEDMSKFNVVDFKKEITKMINKYYSGVYPEFIVSILNRLKNGLANELGVNREESVDMLEDSPSLRGQEIYNMDIDKFLLYVQKRVNKAGEKLKRKINRLYSIKDKDLK